MPTGNTRPILPPSSIVVVWLCGKIRQLNTCTNMYVHSFLCVCVVCICSTMNIHNYATTNHSGGNIGIVVCRKLPSHIILTAL